MNIKIFFIIILIFSQNTLAQTTCNNTLLGVTEFSINKSNQLSAKVFSSEVSQEEIMTHLKKLTGVKDIDCDGCIKGRFTEEQKSRVRNYLLSYLKELGFQPKEEKILYGVKQYRRPGIYAPDLSDAKAQKVLDKDFAGIEEMAKTLKEETFEEGPKSFLVHFLDHYDFFLASLKNIKKDASKILRDKNKSKKEIQEYKRMVSSLIRSVERLADEIKEGNKDWTPIPDEKLYLHNVIVEIPGSIYPDLIVEVTAHYDSTGENKPGADDNGSGLVTALELARLMQNRESEKTLRISFLDLEEYGFHGSRMNAKNLHDDDRRVLGSIVVDMIGYAPAAEYPGQKLPYFVVELGTPDMHENPLSYLQSRELAKVFAHQFLSFDDHVTRLKVLEDSAAPYTADNTSYLENGVPALLVAAPYRDGLINPNYHKSTDTHHYFNLSYFQDILKIILETAAITAGVHIDEAHPGFDKASDDYKDEPVTPYALFENREQDPFAEQADNDDIDDEY